MNVCDDYIIRPAGLADAGAIAELFNRFIADGTHTIMAEPITLEGQLAYMRAYPARGVFLVAVGSGGLFGMQSIEPTDMGASPVADIATFVAPEAQGRGVGAALMAATIARAGHFEKIRAVIRADNGGAIAYYRRQGFELVGETRAGLIAQVVAERLVAGSARSCSGGTGHGPPGR